MADAETDAPGSLAGSYLRAIRLLGPERGTVAALALANAALGAVQLAEPVLLGRVVDAIAADRPAFGLVLLWAVVGLGGIAAGVVVALLADRLAHRRRVAVMADAFERAITLPASRHAREGSGRVVRTM